MSKVKVALCQMMVEKTSKQHNVEKAKKFIQDAAKKGANIVVLPEMFNCPYNNKRFRECGESYPNGETINMMANESRKNKIYLIGGSVPEICDDKVYNTSFIFNDKGELIGKHRKVHLFDIDIKNGVKFKESDVLTAGNQITVVDTPWGKIGVAICYDIRFPEIMRIMALKGASMVFIPAAFNMTTGPSHWETLFKSRALDNQIYCIGVAPARNESYSYISYANSIITNPWGSIVNKLDKEEGMLIEELDLDYISEIRESLPLLKHIRKDLYGVELF